MHSSTDIPESEPTEIVAGDTAKWKRTDLRTHYPASTWSLTYAIRGAMAIDVTATASGDDFSVTISAATTINWTAGIYSWQAYVTKGTERYQVESGTITIKPNLAGITGTYDGRSDAKVGLDAIVAVLKGRATKDQMAYTIAGRRLDKTPIPDLWIMHDRFKSEYQAELKAEKIKNGLATGGKILTRFVN